MSAYASNMQDSLQALLDRLSDMSEGERLKVISSLFGRRGKKAISAFKMNDTIMKLQGYDIYIVKGDKKNYLLFGLSYCSCEDFYLNNVLRKISKPCYHQLLLALVLAAKTPIKEVNVNDFKKYIESDGALIL